MRTSELRQREAQKVFNLPKRQNDDVGVAVLQVSIEHPILT
jgi:hypothetical protein